MEVPAGLIMMKRKDGSYEPEVSNSNYATPTLDWTGLTPRNGFSLTIRNTRLTHLQHLYQPL